MIKVAVAGCAGRMGTAVSDAVRAAEDLELVCGVDPQGEGGGDVPVFASVPEALAGADFDVLVDFTQPAVVEANLRAALPAGVDCVVGTTGLSNETLDELAAIAPAGTCLFYAPNFTTGAVLMMQFAKAAAPYFPEAEVLEFHHARKLDAPSGTAVRTAQIIAEARGHRASEAPGARDRDPWGRRRARRARGRRPGALRALDGLRGQPGGRVRGLWARRSPSATTAGTAPPICLACFWASAASARKKA